MSFTIDLSGRRALVTGGGQNVGFAIASALAEAGAAVLVNDYFPDRAADAAAKIAAEGGNATALPFDVTDWDAVRSAIHESGTDILVNNAGNAGAEQEPAKGDLFLDTEPASWEPFLRVNLYGVLHCCRAAVPGMVERGWGRVITIVSDAGRVGQPRQGVYSAAKAGAAAFSRSLATEVGRSGVTVNCISLSMTPHPEWEAFTRDDERRAKLLRPYSIKRFGRPSDPAGLAVFLASDLGEWVTGQTYPVNGGYASAV